MSQESTEIATRESGKLAEYGQVNTGQQSLAVTPEYVQNTVRSLSLLRHLVQEVLEEGRDYGSVPGIPDFLWDAGASAIIASFNCHVGQRRIIDMKNDGKNLSIVIEVPLIHNTSQSEVGSGIGATTVAETKYKYRWERNPQDWGYSEEEIAKLETRQRYEHTEYKIINPEPGDLLNTVVKMASKRAEVDAAEALPGAASALKELLSPKSKGGYRKSNANRPTRDEDGETARWNNFWSQANVLMGTLAKQKKMQVADLVHQMLGVTSMKEWLKSGKSLDDAIRLLGEKLASGSTDTPRQVPDSRTADDITDVDSLVATCEADFGMSENEVFKELGYTSKKSYVDAGIDDPYQSYLVIKSYREEAEPEDLPF